MTEQTPPPPVTAQIVLAELGSSIEQLLERYQAANNGDAPPPKLRDPSLAARRTRRISRARLWFWF